MFSCYNISSGYSICSRVIAYHQVIEYYLVIAYHQVTVYMFSCYSISSGYSICYHVIAYTVIVCYRVIAYHHPSISSSVAQLHNRSYDIAHIIRMFCDRLIRYRKSVVDLAAGHIISLVLMNVTKIYVSSRRSSE